MKRYIKRPTFTYDANGIPWQTYRRTIGLVFLWPPNMPQMRCYKIWPLPLRYWRWVDTSPLRLILSHHISSYWCQITNSFQQVTLDVVSIFKHILIEPFLYLCMPSALILSFSSTISDKEDPPNRSGMKERWREKAWKENQDIKEWIWTRRPLLQPWCCWQ